MSDALLVARGLVKRYRSVTALAGLDLELGRGEVLALLGPNGAGKTTALRLVLGLIAPDEGTLAWHLGGSPGAPPPRERVGYLPEERGLFREAPIARTVAHFGILRGMPRAAAEREAAAWLARFGLAERAREKPDALSKGNQQKVQLAAALVHRPELAVLDEPFSGLDPQNQELFLEILGELRARGAGVLLSAHQLQLVERAADRIVVLRAGESRFEGSLAEARARASRGGMRIELELGSDQGLDALADCRAIARIERLDASRVALQVRGGEPLGPVLERVARLEVRSLSSIPPSLHELYLELVGDGLPAVEVAP